MKNKNNVMRAFCIVLVAIMTLSILPIGLFDTMAKAQTKAYEINTIYINDAVTTPIVGKTVAISLYNTLPDSANYTITFNNWYNDTKNAYMNSTDTFNANDKYSCGWIVKANEGYTFTEDTIALINESTVAVDSSMSTISSSDSTKFNIWTKSTKANTIIDTININDAITTPIVGKTAGELLNYTIPADAPFTVEFNRWNDDTIMSTMDNDSVFEAAKDYSRGWKLNAKAGYTFTENTKVLVNGSNAHIDPDNTFMNNSDNSVFYVWTIPSKAVAGKEKIDTININDAITTPIVGKTAGESFTFTLPENAPYTVSYHGWYNDTDNVGMDDESIFEKEKMYSLNWTIQAKEGYTFTKDTKVLINNSTAAIDTSMTAIRETDSTVFSVWTIPSKAVAEKEKIDTININDAITTPIVGKTVGESFTFTLPENAPYTVSYHGWYNDTDEVGMDDESIFEKEKMYSLNWTIQAKEGYTFTKDTKVLINNSTAAIDTSMTAISETDSTVFSVWTISTEAVVETVKEKITNIAIKNADITPILGKTAGDCLAYTLPTDAPYTVTLCQWYNDTDEKLMNDADVFEAGKTYLRKWDIKAKDGYTFTNDTRVSINYSSAYVDKTCTFIDDSDSTLFYVWSIPTNPVIEIQTIDITDADITPIAGKTAGELLAYTIPADALYTVIRTEWYNDTERQEMSVGSVFNEDNAYMRGWTLQAKEGCAFTKNTKVLINGSENNVDKDYTRMASDTGSAFYVMTKSVELAFTGETSNIDTININNADIIPILGKTVSEIFYSSVPADAPYTILGFACLNITDDEPMYNTSVFKADKEYIFGWILNSKTGCVFTEDTKVLINGKADFVDGEASKIFENPKQFKVWTIPTKAVADSEKISIDTITINNANTTPVLGKTAGECVDYTIPADSLYTVTECFWYDDTIGAQLKNSDIFVADIPYYIVFVIKAKAGYIFTEKTKILLNGSETSIDTDNSGMDYYNSSLFYVLSIPTKAVEQKYEPGDVNLDGKVNTGDAVLILRQIAGTATFTEEQTALADFNKDGKVNTGDAVAILKYCVGIKSEKICTNKQNIF